MTFIDGPHHISSPTVAATSSSTPVSVCVTADEADACTRGAARARHQRYRLLRGLVEDRRAPR